MRSAKMIEISANVAAYFAAYVWPASYAGVIFDWTAADEEPQEKAIVANNPQAIAARPEALRPTRSEMRLQGRGHMSANGSFTSILDPRSSILAIRIGWMFIPKLQGNRAAAHGPKDPKRTQDCGPLVPIRTVSRIQQSPSLVIGCEWIGSLGRPCPQEARGMNPSLPGDRGRLARNCAPAEEHRGPRVTTLGRTPDSRSISAS
jgi:hypothetical protein